MGYERYIDNGDGTVTDKSTKLIWLKDVNCMETNYPNFDQDNQIGTVGDGLVQWQHALDFVKGINDGTYPLCGAGHTDWRLPNYWEALTVSAVERTNDPVKHPFINFPTISSVSHATWTSTTYMDVKTSAFIGSSGIENKRTSNHLVWPVRGGQ
jgi:hypothetical protein